MRFSSLSLAVAAAAASAPTVLGWGAAGHEIVATIAQMYLAPGVLPTLCHILNYTSPDPSEPLCHLAPIATWADKLRYKMRWSAALHYVGGLDDHPSQTCAFPGPRGWAGSKGGNVLGAIRNVTGLLEEWTEGERGDDVANEALKFLVHFVGDLHMPLHLTGRERGGNSVKVLFDRKQTNLHSLWDGLLIAKAIRTTPLNYTRPLPYPRVEHALRGTIYDSYIRRILWEGLFQKWAGDGQEWLSCPASEEVQAQAPQGAWQTVLRGWSRVFGNNDIPGETDDETLCPYAWAKPLHQLNCDIVWPKALDEPPYGGVTASEAPPLLQLDTPEYAGVIADTMLVEKLLAQAGIRLAGVLNWLFAPGGPGGLSVMDIRM